MLFYELGQRRMKIPLKDEMDHPDCVWGKLSPRPLEDINMTERKKWFDYYDSRCERIQNR